MWHAVDSGGKSQAAGGSEEDVKEEASASAASSTRLIERLVDAESAVSRLDPKRNLRVVSGSHARYR